MVYWLHSTLAKAEVFESEERARQALEGLVKRLKAKGYQAQEVRKGHFHLTHASEGFVEAYIDVDGPEVGGDDET